MRLKADRIAWRQIGDDVVVLDLRSSTYLSANDTAATLWRALEHGASRDALVTALVSEFDVDDERAGADVDAFLADCRARDLIDEAP